MAYSAELAWVGSTGEHNMKTGPQYEAGWRVFTDDPLHQAQRVIQWFRANVVELSDEYEYANDTLGSIAIAKRIAAKRELGSTNVWIVTVTYEPYDEKSDDPGRDNNGNPTDNPLLFRPKISVRTNRYSVPVEKAKYLIGMVGVSALAIDPGDERIPCNSAFDPFDPGLEKDEIRILVTIQRNMLGFDATQAAQYVDTINTHAFQINLYGLRVRVLAREAKLGDFEAPEVARLNGIDYWPITWGFEVKGSDWIDEVVDRGWHALARAGDPDGKGGTLSNNDIVPGRPKRRKLVDNDEMPFSTPPLLNGAGQPLDPPEAEPIYISWIKYEEHNILTIDFFNGILTPL